MTPSSNSGAPSFSPLFGEGVGDNTSDGRALKPGEKEHDFGAASQPFSSDLNGHAFGAKADLNGHTFGAERN